MLTTSATVLQNLLLKPKISPKQRMLMLIEAVCGLRQCDCMMSSSPVPLWDVTLGGADHRHPVFIDEKRR